MISPRAGSVLPVLLLVVVHDRASPASASPVSCTKSKNGGDILLYGNSDWAGGWTEVYADPAGRRRDRGLLRALGDSLGGTLVGGRDLVVAAGATFGLMFEMDCDACSAGPSCRTFDFDLMTSAGDIVAEHSFEGQAIPYRHYISDVIDHSIFTMDDFGPVPEGEYTYCVTSYVDTGSGPVEEASMCGTLLSLMDSENPVIEVVSAPSAPVSPGTTVEVVLDVSDDAVMNYVNVNANGEYNQRIGVKTVGNKVYASQGTPLQKTVSYVVPSKGKVVDRVLDFQLCDLTGKCAGASVTVEVQKSGGKPNKV